MTEKQLQKEVFTYLSGDHNEYIATEVPCMNRVIDIAKIQHGRISTYELKLKNWKKAIKQLKDQRMSANYCYICMPKEMISVGIQRKIVDGCMRYGLGFLLWDSEKKYMHKILVALNQLPAERSNAKLNANIVDVARIQSYQLSEIEMKKSLISYKNFYKKWNKEK